MATQYCDSKKLEDQWFLWLSATITPRLDPYRQAGTLWTRLERDIIPQSDIKRKYPSPLASYRTYYIVSDKIYQFECHNGVLPDKVLTNGQLVDYPNPSLLNYHKLTVENCYKEVLPGSPWEYICNDILNICKGVSLKFGNKSDEEREDMAVTAFMQIINKIKREKLIYIPGKAPVFSLLTTAIYRCMYSIVNKEDKVIKKRTILAEGISNGLIKSNMRSLRVAAGY